MIGNFDTALKHVLVHEGGYVNHPADPGGATNKGITQATYNSWRRGRGLVTRSVREITDAEVASIYKGSYWDLVKGDDLPSGVDYAVFDFAVNSGPRRAAEFLQRIVGAAVDGKIGPETLGKTKAMAPVVVINTLVDKRLAWLKTLGTWNTFGRGWTNRIAGMRRDALVMAQVVTQEPGVENPGLWKLLVQLYYAIIALYRS